VPSFEQARTIVLENVPTLGSEIVPTIDAVGRVLAEDFSAPWDMPRWDNSAMDGYAVRAEECAGGVRLAVSGYIPAGGHATCAVVSGTAAKILTGAPLPLGADAVVPVEEVEEGEATILVPSRVLLGANVRRKGEDMRAGEIVLRSGTVVGPAEVCLLASYATSSVAVVRQARVAIVSTGDELVALGAPLSPGKIYDANAVALAASAKQAGAVPVVLGIARDDRASLRRLLAEGLKADALVTSAGVSVGDRDLVRDVLEELSVRQLFWKVDVKPGRPTAFALYGDKPVFSLPGNPVSALLTFDQLVRPGLLKMMGRRDLSRPRLRARLMEHVGKKPGRAVLLRVRLARRDGELLAWPSGKQDTGILKTTLDADAIAVLPAGEGPLEAGASVSVEVLRGDFEVGEST
jgi:molybdopterin molybdotransferase